MLQMFVQLWGVFLTLRTSIASSSPWMTFEPFINGQDSSFFEVGKINEQPHYLNSIEGMYLQTLNTLQP